MKRLLLLRHAKSSWKNPNLADHDRPLNPRGKRDAPRMGKLIHQQGIVPDVILSSTAKRARKTAAIVAEQCGYDRSIELDGDLYHADVETCIRVLGDVYYDDPILLLVGHNPGLSELLAALTGVNEELPTAALAQMTLPIESWRALSVKTDGTLANLWRPRELE